MNGQENLIPVTERTKEEAREIARKGGINSGKSRREKKLLKEALIQAMNMKDLNTGKKNSVSMALAIITKVIKGKASISELEFIRDTVDGKPEETVNVKSSKLEDFFSDE